MQIRVANFIARLFLLSSLGLYGCAVAVVGIGAAGAAGAFSYFNGRLTKTYESEYHETVRVSSDTLERLKIPIAEVTADELKTEIKAKRPDGTPVAIEVIRIDQNHTEVAVRTGSWGIWDKRVSEQIHSYIDQNLKESPINAEKLSNHSVKEDMGSTAGEGDEPKIKVEDLDDNSAQETVADESAVDQGDQKTTKFAELTVDSIFVIFFKQNSNDLSEKTIEKLDKIFEILTNKPRAEITLNGYSDSFGSASYNKMISEIRANAVKSYLVGKGIKPSRITAIGHGAQKFLASNRSEEGRKFNRRVEIELLVP
jgi:outer membrane protein OmpA-like peptidoglycan-associated protein